MLLKAPRHRVAILKKDSSEEHLGISLFANPTEYSTA